MNSAVSSAHASPISPFGQKWVLITNREHTEKNSASSIAPGLSAMVASGALILVGAAL